MVKKSVQMYNFYTLKIRIARRTASSHSLIIYLFSSCLGTWLIFLVAASSMFTSTRCYLACFCHHSPRCFVFAVALHVYMPDYEDVFVICVVPVGLFLPCLMFSVVRDRTIRQCHNRPVHHSSSGNRFSSRCSGSCSGRVSLSHDHKPNFLRIPHDFDGRPQIRASQAVPSFETEGLGNSAC